MSKYCPILKRKIIYLDCLECEDKQCEKKQENNQDYKQDYQNFTKNKK